MIRLATVGVTLFAAVALCIWGPSYGSASDGWPATADAVVPDAPLPPGGQKIPTVRVPASPAPAPDGTLACRAGQLRAVPFGAGPSAGTFFVTYKLQLSAGHRCVLRGYPRLAALRNAATTTFVRNRAILTEPWHGPVLVSRDTPATLRLAWSTASSFCAPPPTATWLTVVLPGGALRVPGVKMPDLPCHPTKPRRHATVFVAPFAPT